MAWLLSALETPTRMPTPLGQHRLRIPALAIHT